MNKKQSFFSVLVGLMLLLGFGQAGSGNALPAPQHFTVNYTSGTFTFQWDAVDGADGYLVEGYQLGAWKTLATVKESGASYAPGEVMIGSPAFPCRVVACQGTGANLVRGAESSILLAVPTLQAPTLQVSSSWRGVDLSIGVPSGFENFSVSYSVVRQDEQGTEKEIAQIAAPDVFQTISLRDTEAASEHTYIYSVNSSLSWAGQNLGQTIPTHITKNVACETHFFPRVMPAPANFKVEHAVIESMSSDIGFRWTFDPVAGATEYKLYRAELHNYLMGNGLLFYETLTGTSREMGFAPDEVFTTWVIALGPAGEQYSTPSTQLYFGCITACEDLQAVRSEKGVRLSWKRGQKLIGALPDAVFGIYRKTTGDTFQRIAQTTDMQYDDLTATAGTAYEYYVAEEVAIQGVSPLQGDKVDVLLSSSDGPHVQVAADASLITLDSGKYTANGSTATFIAPADTSLSDISVPDKISANGKTFKVTSIGSAAFKGLTSLKRVTIGKYVQDIGEKAFQNCSKLQKVEGGKAVKMIRDSAFASCKKLASLPALSKLESIGKNAFKNCAALAKVTLGSKLKSIGEKAFYGCKKLKTITIRATKLTSNSIGKNAFKGVPSSATVKCPAKKLIKYKSLLVKKGISKKARFE